MPILTIKFYKMKKILGVLGVAVIAVAMFFSANANTSSDLDLASLISLNSANAECVVIGPTNFYGCNAFDRCVYTGVPAPTCSYWEYPY